MGSIRPSHYVDKRGHDRFWKYEHGHIPATLAIGFCQENIWKYLDRAGKKTADPTEDFAKARTYLAEWEKLMHLKAAGMINDQGLDKALDSSGIKARSRAISRYIDRLELEGGRR